MFILSAGLIRTGTLDMAITFVLRFARESQRRLFLLLTALVPTLSAFANNTPIVVMMIPITLTVCRRLTISPSKLLMPINYLAILGGTCTLIGTSTNILVNDLSKRNGGPEFGIFEFSLLGILNLSIGIVYLYFLSDKLLPNRTPVILRSAQDRGGTFDTEVIVQAESSLIGQPISAVFGEGAEVTILEIIRGREVLRSPIDPNTIINPDDALIIHGTAKDIRNLISSAGVVLASAIEEGDATEQQPGDSTLAEAVILSNSPYVGRRLSRIGLNRLYGVKVLGIERLGRPHRLLIRETRLKVGDVLLVQADVEGLVRLREAGGVMVVEEIQQTLVEREKAPIALAIMVGVVTLAALNVFPIVSLTLTGAALMLLTRCLRLSEATQAMDTSVLLLMAGTIPLGLAMIKTGLAFDIAHNFLSVIGTTQPWVVIGGIYFLTMFFTSFISNTATAALMVPVALGVATEIGMDPVPLMIAIIFGASACFATPISYHTNLMVLGPGGYTFRDFVRIGLPLNLVLWVFATIAIPIFFPP
jgi:di/tricarboxylate transporter